LDTVRILVTGASRGIGRGFCRVLLERGHDVVAVCREPSRDLSALDVQIIDGIELTDDSSVRTLSRRIRGGLDGLILNAGINCDAPRLEEIEVSDLARMFDVNALGAVRVTLACLGSLNRGAKIMFVGVGAAALNVRAPSIGNYGYRMSKAAMLSFGFGLARDLRDREVAVLVCSPGPVDTDMLRGVAAEGRTTFNPEHAPPADSVAAQLLDRMDGLTLEDSPVWEEKPTGEPLVVVPTSQLVGQH
jgi:NAD(P)-dependent dehydrogenase (short-subunit alcohol dehydrogenase family)